MELRDKTNAFFAQSAENGLQLRSGQVEMADEVSSAIERNTPLAVEAEVGIGKSFAYLIPAIIKLSEDHCQIVIATSTIALQEQLSRDANSVLRMLGEKIEIVVAKGMKNYICKRKLRSLSIKHPNDTLLDKLWYDADMGKQDRADIRYYVPQKLWDRICIVNFGSHFCRSCEYTFSCSYSNIRKNIAVGGNLVICNQNMLVSHLSNLQRGHGIFSRNCSVYIVDEAHNLEKRFREIFTVSYSRIDMIKIINRCADSVNAENKRLSDVLVKSIGLTIQALYKELVRQIKEQKEKYDEDKKAFYFSLTKEAAHYLSELSRKIERFERYANVTAGNLICFLNALMNKYNGNIVWLEDGANIRICMCKQDIRRDIAQMLYSSGNVILTSATISDKSEGTPYERCKYYLDSIGFPKHGEVSEPKCSPFDYRSNALMYSSRNMPYPKYDERDIYRNAAISEIIRLINITGGKTLILFTARSDMEFVYKKLSNMHLPYKIFIQHNSASQAYVLEKFRKDINSVILGTGTFWEGINVEGKSLSQVIIYKLPFPAPDPIIDYKMSLSDDPIMDVAVPEMIIKLRQGTGRLIRSENDKGIISILDPRLSSTNNAKYRQAVLSAFSDFRITEDIALLRQYWEKMK